MPPDRKGTKQVADNRRARHEYYVLESYEAGIELFGTEVKSIRKGAVNMRDSWCDVTAAGELYVKGLHISPYEQGNIFNREPTRDRKLLMHRREIKKLRDEVMQQGLTLIPLALYFKNSRVKVQLGLCRGKKLHDKRAAAAERDARREIQRHTKAQGQGFQ